ncbi:MAG: type II toxin-antitoxin system VapC family toxin [Thermoanaerobaculia bacterium]
MTAVVDASVLVAAAADAGPEGIWAERLVGNGPLAAPHLVLVEATNILRRLELAQRLTPLEAGSARRDVLHLDIDLLPFEPFADRIWELRKNLTCYDAWYVAVAEALELPLATLDRRLASATGPSCRFLIPT